MHRINHYQLDSACNWFPEYWTVIYPVDSDIPATFEQLGPGIMRSPPRTGRLVSPCTDVPSSLRKKSVEETNVLVYKENAGFHVDFLRKESLVPC